MPKHRPWPKEWTRRLRDYAAEGLTREEAAARLGITKNAVIGKVHRMGLKMKNAPRGIRPTQVRQLEPRIPQQRHINTMWTEKRINTLVTMRNAGKSYEEIGEALGFGPRSARSKAHKLKSLGYVILTDVRAIQPHKPKPTVKPFLFKKQNSGGAHDGIIDLHPREGEPKPLGHDRGCQWLPASDKPRFFCGRPVVGETAWCEYHRSRVYDRVRTSKSNEDWRSRNSPRRPQLVKTAA